MVQAKLQKKWDRLGLVLEHLGFNKYRVKIDGSGRDTDRNRQFLKQFTPVTPSMPGPTPNTANPNPQPTSKIPLNHDPVQERLQHFIDPSPSPPVTPAPQLERTHNSPASPTFVTPPSSPVQSQSIPEPISPSPEPVALPETPILPRRSTRVNLGQPPDRLRYDKF